jgi:uncharacterized protein
MAVESLLTLIDDIATILDDVAAMSKVAVKKTAGVLGDDLALNAQQVSGVKTDRELPVVWAVAKGSLVNKAILIPIALAISAIFPWAVQPLLMIGGLYLCFEGVEKLAHKFFHSDKEDAHRHEELLAHLADPKVDMVEVEKVKIRGAVRTDFVLSAEIIVIALGSVADQTFLHRVLVLVVIGMVMTVGVYGLVAAIVKMDDVGLYLSRQARAGSWGTIIRAVGRATIYVAPLLLKFLSVAGTVAMFLVGGHILLHGVPAAEEAVHHMLEGVSDISVIGGLLELLGSSLIDAILGVLAGIVALVVFEFGSKWLGRRKAKH